MLQVSEPSASRTAGSVASHCSYVTGDRLCIKCGYNLIGQSILREPHYDLLIVRCPECGAVTGVQEYPLLGPWAHRWGMLIAALWFILILGLWAGSSGTIMGLSMGAAEEGGWEYQQYISHLHDQHVEREKLLQQQQAAAQPQANQPQATENAEQETEAESTAQTDESPSDPDASGQQAQAASPVLPTVPAIPNLPAGTSTTVVYDRRGVRVISGGGGTGGGTDFATWWKQQDRDAILASVGGWMGAVDWEIIAIWAVSALLVFVIGCFWAVVLVQMRRSRLLLWGLVILALAWLFALIPIIDWLRGDLSYAWGAARAAARQQVSPPLLICSLILLTIPLALGLLLGRPIVRQSVRGLLPPRLRGSLALLWTTDGKRPPVGGYPTHISKS